MKKLKVWERYHFRHLPELRTGITAEERITGIVKDFETKIKELEETISQLGVKNQ